MNQANSYLPSLAEATAEANAFEFWPQGITNMLEELQAKFIDDITRVETAMKKKLHGIVISQNRMLKLAIPYKDYLKKDKCPVDCGKDMAETKTTKCLNAGLADGPDDGAEVYFNKERKGGHHRKENEGEHHHKKSEDQYHHKEDEGEHHHMEDESEHHHNEDEGDHHHKEDEGEHHHKEGEDQYRHREDEDECHYKKSEGEHHHK